MTADQLTAQGFDFQVFTAPYPLVAIVSNLPMDSAYEYFGPRQLDETTTLNDLISEGGVMVSQQVTYGHDAEKVKSELGDKAHLLDFGPYQASLSLGSSLVDGSPRPYDIYWSDGKYDYSVVAGTHTAGEAVAVARSNLCS